MKQRVARAGPSRVKKAPGVSPVEYVLLLMPRYNERKKSVVTYVALRTVKEFTNFRYEIVVNHRLEGRTLYLDIQGLRVPELTLPGAGPAIFETEYDTLSGDYEIVVRGLRKETNRFRVTISPDKVRVEKNPEAGFIDLVTSREEW